MNKGLKRKIDMTKFLLLRSLVIDNWPLLNKLLNVVYSFVHCAMQGYLDAS
jgi:hypothetical protein